MTNFRFHRCILYVFFFGIYGLNCMWQCFQIFIYTKQIFVQFFYVEGYALENNVISSAWLQIDSLAFKKVWLSTISSIRRMNKNFSFQSSRLRSILKKIFFFFQKTPLKKCKQIARRKLKGDHYDIELNQRINFKLYTNFFVGKTTLFLYHSKWWSFDFTRNAYKISFFK